MAVSICPDAISVAASKKSAARSAIFFASSGGSFPSTQSTRSYSGWGFCPTPIRILGKASLPS